MMCFNINRVVCKKYADKVLATNYHDISVIFFKGCLLRCNKHGTTKNSSFFASHAMTVPVS